ncbi:hypothetical protein SynBIOSE41_03704 [Synechococcus sp. BIOS-E4-1]|nr:hypothetical protein SynBIOSE41_03704 [Synechococcus sp. BIOS-E4-1]
MNTSVTNSLDNPWLQADKLLERGSPGRAECCNQKTGI